MSETVDLDRLDVVDTGANEEDGGRDNEDDAELMRMPSTELASAVKQYKESQKPDAGQSSGRQLLVNMLMGGGNDEEAHDDDAEHEDGKHKHVHKKGAFAGVFVPTCENMWGVLIFLRFYFIVGHAGVGYALVVVFLSFSCAFCTVSSMTAIVSSGGLVAQGGPYYMISRALGPSVGASVGIMYWLALTMLAVLETLGAVEGILMANEDAYFGGAKQVYGSVLMAVLAAWVFMGIGFISKLGIFFVFIVFSTLYMYYHGLIAAPNTDEARSNTMVTGLSLDTLEMNWGSHYGDGVDFGMVLSVFYPCFTGILSGANRADILKDPPKNLQHGTFGAIIFSLFMYSSFMVLWGMVAEYPYLQGELTDGSGSSSGRRLAGGGGGAHLVEEIVWNPFPHAAHVGIIIASMSQALQCLVVAPRLLQNIARDEILPILNKVAPLTNGEPKRALLVTYIVAGLLVLLGQLDLVAPLLSMCFLVTYAFMNCSCFALTWLKSPAWRPKGIHKKRWRLWYMITAGPGFVLCVTTMFLISWLYALLAIFLALSIYFYINYRIEAKDWGSAADGIRFQLALNSLIQLEASQHHHVNWRPQVLILYKIHLAEELKGIKHHEILRFYSQLRKGNGFCVVACVLEAPDKTDEHALHKAQIEKGVIQSIMKEENLAGFAEVVVAPNWVEGCNYIIQLTGIGGLVPNTVLLDWPEGWQASEKAFQKAQDFVQILRTALGEEKAVLAMKGINDIPLEQVYGTIDVWWMIHDGGFLILLSWLLVQHRIWRRCHIRVFTITEGVTPEQAKSAAEMLTRTLRARRLFDVDVEVILADHEIIEPYTHDNHLREEERHKYLQQLQEEEHVDASKLETIPLEINDLFKMGEQDASHHAAARTVSKEPAGDDEATPSHAHVSDMRSKQVGKAESGRSDSATRDVVQEVRTAGGASSSKAQGEAGKAEPQDGSDKKAPTEKPRQPEPSEPPPAAAGKADRVSFADQKDQDKKKPPQLETGEELPRRTSSGNLSGEEGASSTPTRANRGVLQAMVSPSSENQEEELVTLERDASDVSEKAKRSSQAKVSTARHVGNVEAFNKLNNIIFQKSKRAQLVIMNLPDLWNHGEPEEVQKFMSYCETLTKNLDRVLFVHSSGHEIFDISI